MIVSTIIMIIIVRIIVVIILTQVKLAGPIQKLKYKQPILKELCSRKPVFL